MPWQLKGGLLVVTLLSLGNVILVRMSRMNSHSFLSLGPDGFHRIAYTDWGDLANPHAVLCVHGLARNSRDFDRLADRLAETCRVVCMDVVGRGDSEWLSDKSSYCFPTYLSDAAALIARITSPARPSFLAKMKARLLSPLPVTQLDWVGTSMGGLIGMLLAAKPGSPIRHLVMNDVGPFVPWSALVRLKDHVGAQTSFVDVSAVEAHLRRACATFGTFDEAWWAHLVENGADACDDGSYRLRYDPDISRGLPVHSDPELPIGPEFLSGIDLWSVWKEVRCPVLVLRGEKSDVLPREVADEMLRSRDNVKVIEFPGVGHAPSLAVPEQVEAVRRFLFDLPS